jgi:hypothetical protein
MKAIVGIIAASSLPVRSATDVARVLGGVEIHLRSLRVDDKTRRRQLPKRHRNDRRRSPVSHTVERMPRLRLSDAARHAYFTRVAFRSSTKGMPIRCRAADADAYSMMCCDVGTTTANRSRNAAKLAT